MRPWLSVVIPTIGRDSLALTLESLRAQAESAGVEVLVVGDTFGGYSHRDGTGNAYRRYAGNARNWREIYPLGFLPTFSSTSTDWSAVGGLRGVVSGWNYDLGAEFGHNHFDYDMTSTLNPSLGPCLDPENPCAPPMVTSVEVNVGGHTDGSCASSERSTTKKSIR